MGSAECIHKPVCRVSTAEGECLITEVCKFYQGAPATPAVPKKTTRKHKKRGTGSGQAGKRRGEYKKNKLGSPGREGVEDIEMLWKKTDEIIKARGKLHNLDLAGKLSETQIKALENTKGISAKSLTEGQVWQIFSILDEATGKET